MKIATVPFLLLCALLLALPGAAGADQTAIQVSATILSRCQLSTERVEADGRGATASIARCNDAGETLAYRVASAGAKATPASLPRNTARTIATTTTHGEVLTIEF